jgi:hypothetical protein
VGAAAQRKAIARVRVPARTGSGEERGDVDRELGNARWNARRGQGALGHPRRRGVAAFRGSR